MNFACTKERVTIGPRLSNNERKIDQSKSDSKSIVWLCMPSVNGAQSIIARPIVNANTFKIKLSLIQMV